MLARLAIMKSPGNKEKSRVFTDESVNFVVIVLFWLPAVSRGPASQRE